MEKQKENEGSTSKNIKKIPRKKNPSHSSDASSETSSSSLTGRLQKFDSSFPEYFRPKGKPNNVSVEESTLDYFTNLPPSGINLTESTTDIVKKLVQAKAKSTIVEATKKPKLRSKVKSFPTVDEDLTTEEGQCESCDDSSSYESITSENLNYGVERKKKEAEKKEKGQKEGI